MNENQQRIIQICSDFQEYSSVTNLSNIVHGMTKKIIHFARSISIAVIGFQTVIKNETNF